MSLFLHERLDAYQALCRLARVVHRIIHQLPRGHASLADQLTRAVRTSRLALAEGANTRLQRMKLVYFDRAVASGGECAACLDELRDFRLVPADLIDSACQELNTSVRCTLGLMKRLR